MEEVNVRKRLKEHFEEIQFSYLKLILKYLPKHLNCPWFYQPDTPNTKIIISITLLMRLIIFQTASYLWFPPPTSGNDSQIQLHSCLTGSYKNKRLIRDV